MESNGTALVFDGVTYRYDDGTPALDGVSFSIDRGESVAIIGHNGSGKTTLLMHIVGIIVPEGGVTVSGVTVTEATLGEVRRRVGYVFQDSRDQLFMSTVMDDVAFGPLNMGLSPVEAVERSNHALSAVGLDGYAGRTPYHLSGGEMKRVAIATVLAQSPEILVMDEPSSGLDPRARRGLASLIRGLGCTRLVASHDLDFVRACADRVILLNRGHIAADGPAAAILDNRVLLEENGL